MGRIRLFPKFNMSRVMSVRVLVFFISSFTSIIGFLLLVHLLLLFLLHFLLFLVVLF